jgi:hypothetical protein
MKKIIAASAALVLLGAMASTASAATITFSGDARARFYYKDNYAPGAQFNTPVGTLNGKVVTTNGSDETYWQSRVRLVFKIETKGGAYAIGRFRLADTMNAAGVTGTPGWDGGGGTNYTGPGQNTSAGAYNVNRGSYKNNVNDFRADIAYVGIPFSGGYAIEAGVGPNTMDRFFRADAPYNWIRGRYTNDQSGTTVLAFMEKLSEYRPLQNANNHGLSYANDPYDDNANSDDDVNNYGLRLTQKLNGGWLLDASVFYLDDQQGAQNGYGAVGRISGKINETTVYGGAAFRSADYQNWLYGGTANTRVSYKDNSKYTADADMNGWGFFVGANQPIGIASIGLTAGMTFNGYTASGDFGEFDGVPFVMLGNGSQNTTWGMLNTGILLGSAVSNAWFVNIAPSVKVSDKLTLTAEATYANVDMLGVSNGKYTTDGKSIVEVGGIAQYQIVDGAKITALLGYLNIEDADNNPLGFGLSLDLAF